MILRGLKGQLARVAQQAAGPLAPCPAPEATCSCCGPPATVDRARSHELASTSFSPLQQHHQRGLQAPYGVSAELAKPRRPETVQSGEPAAAKLRRVTPAQLAALSEVLHMSAKDVQDLLQRQPVLAEADAAQLAASMASARQELGINGRSVRLLVRREPKMLLRMTSSQISEAAQRLAGELRVPKSAVLKAASTAPSILRRDPAVVSSRLHSMSAKLGGISMPDMLQLVAGAPQYLTEAPSKLERRLAEACRALHRPPRLVVKALLLQADLLFMSPRILANKLKVLQSILDKDARQVQALVLACPPLLRTHMNGVRASYEVLPSLISRGANHAYAMVCRQPSLLLRHPRELCARGHRLRRAVAAVPEWAAEWKRMSPAQLADCFACTWATYARLDFLISDQLLVSGVSLVSVLTMARSSFVSKYPAAANRGTANAQQTLAPAAAGRAGHQQGQVPLTPLTASAALHVNGVSSVVSRAATGRLASSQLPWADPSTGAVQQDSRHRRSAGLQGQGPQERRMTALTAGPPAAPIVLFPPQEQHVLSSSHEASTAQMPQPVQAVEVSVAEAHQLAQGVRRLQLQPHNGMVPAGPQHDQGQQQGPQLDQLQRKPGRRRRRQDVQLPPCSLPSQQQQDMQGDASMAIGPGQSAGLLVAASQPRVTGSSEHVLVEANAVPTVAEHAGEAVPLVPSLSLQPSHLVDGPVHISWSDQQLQQDLQAALLEQQQQQQQQAVLSHSVAATGSGVATNGAGDNPLQDVGAAPQQEQSQEEQVSHHVKQEIRRRVRVPASASSKVAGGSRGSHGSSRTRHTAGPILLDDSGPLSPQTAMPLVAAQLQ